MSFIRYSHYKIDYFLDNKQVIRAYDLDEYEALTGKGNKTEKIELKTEPEEPQNEATFDADDEDLDVDENIVDIELYNVVSAFNVGCTLNLTELSSKFWAAWPKRAVSIFGLLIWSITFGINYI